MSYEAVSGDKASKAVPRTRRSHGCSECGYAIWRRWACEASGQCTAHYPVTQRKAGERRHPARGLQFLQTTLEASSKPDVSRNHWASRGLIGSICGETPARNPDPDAGGDLYHDRANALRTRFRATISTPAHTMIRSLAASTIYTRPVEPELECSASLQVRS
jgi:hypothetical protein